MSVMNVETSVEVAEIIEVVSPEHIEQFRALLMQYATEREGGFSERMLQDLRDLPGRYAAPNGGMFIARVPDPVGDGEPVGCAAWTKVRDGIVEMKRVYVQPNQRGKGIARALSMRVIREARERGYAQVAISTWNNATPAIVLYESLGFKPIPPFKQSPFPNLVFMGLDMTNHHSPFDPSPFGSAQDGSGLRAGSVTSQVIKVSGSDLDDPVFSRRFASSVAALAKSGAAPVIVHGGGKELTELLIAMRVETRFVDGLRVTDARTRDAALMVLSGLANKRLVAELLAQGVDAIGVSGLDAGLIRVVRLSLELEFVGKPVSVRTELLVNWVGQGIVPVISPMSIGSDGEIYNVNADHVAGAIAAAMDADMLTFVTNVRGVLDSHKSLVTSLTKDRAEALIADGTISGGMIPKVRTALEALDTGVSKVRITDLDGVTDNTGTVFVK